MKTVIIDYHMGNIGSIKNMLKKLGYTAKISSNEEEIKEADRLILPGVGSFDQGMKNIRDLDLFDCLNRQVIQEKKLILGICLGMQLLTEGSEEGTSKGFGWIKGRSLRFKFAKDTSFKVPHMGWNTVEPAIKDSLFFEMKEEIRFYFVHSYYVSCDDDKNVLCWTDYEHRFASGIESGNVLGVQFHPEKSHKFGMKLLTNFMEKEV